MELIDRQEIVTSYKFAWEQINEFCKDVVDVFSKYKWTDEEGFTDYFCYGEIFGWSLTGGDDNMIRIETYYSYFPYETHMFLNIPLFVYINGNLKEYAKGRYQSELNKVNKAKQDCQLESPKKDFKMELLDRQEIIDIITKIKNRIYDSKTEIDEESEINNSYKEGQINALDTFLLDLKVHDAFSDEDDSDYI